MTSEIAKSGLYLETLPLWMRGLISIPEHSNLLRELRLLERRTSRVGKDIVDHGRAGSDDYANAVAGCIHWCDRRTKYPLYDTELRNVMQTPEERARRRGSANVNRLSFLSDMMTSRFW